MAWKKPKTNWKALDTFGADDYNRIKNNLNWLSDALDVDIVDMGNDKQVGDLIPSSEITKFPNNLYTLNFYTYKLSIADNKYSGNKKAPNYKEWNRVEGAILMLHDLYEVSLITRDRLPKILGRKQIGTRV